MFQESFLALRALFRLRGYEPQPVTPIRLANWLFQYPRRSRVPLLQMLNSVELISKQEAIDTMVRLNEEVLKKTRGRWHWYRKGHLYFAGRGWK